MLLEPTRGVSGCRGVAMSPLLTRLDPDCRPLIPSCSNDSVVLASRLTEGCSCPGGRTSWAPDDICYGCAKETQPVLVMGLTGCIPKYFEMMSDQGLHRMKPHGTGWTKLCVIQAALTTWSHQAQKLRQSSLQTLSFSNRRHSCNHDGFNAKPKRKILPSPAGAPDSSASQHTSFRRECSAWHWSKTL